MALRHKKNKIRIIRKKFWSNALKNKQYLLLKKENIVKKIISYNKGS